jgi:hypothetical protein
MAASNQRSIFKILRPKETRSSSYTGLGMFIQAKKTTQKMPCDSPVKAHVKKMFRACRIRGGMGIHLFPIGDSDYLNFTKLPKLPKDCTRNVDIDIYTR